MPWWIDGRLETFFIFLNSRLETREPKGFLGFRGFEVLGFWGSRFLGSRVWGFIGGQCFSRFGIFWNRLKDRKDPETVFKISSSIASPRSWHSWHNSSYGEWDTNIEYIGTTTPHYDTILQRESILQPKGTEAKYVQVRHFHRRVGLCLGIRFHQCPEIIKVPAIWSRKVPPICCIFLISLFFLFKYFVTECTSRWNQM